jgi:hypothetical protein
MISMALPMPTRRELHASGHRRALHGGDDGLGQLKPRRPQGPARGAAAVLGEVEGADGVAQIEVGDRLEVPAGAEGAALAPEHGDAGGFVGIELLEGGDQCVGALRVHGVARLGASVDDGPDWAGLLDANGHGASSEIKLSLKV